MTDHLVCFISYDRNFRDTEKGCFDAIVERLESRLQSVNPRSDGRDAYVWYDRNIEPDEFWWQEILRTLRHSALFVPLLSPGWLSRPMCRREFLEYRRSNPSLDTVIPVLIDGDLKTLSEQCERYGEDAAALRMLFDEKQVEFVPLSKLLQICNNHDERNKFLAKVSETVAKLWAPAVEKYVARERSRFEPFETELPGVGDLVFRRMPPGELSVHRGGGLTAYFNRGFIFSETALGAAAFRAGFGLPPGDTPLSRREIREALAPHPEFTLPSVAQWEYAMKGGRDSAKGKPHPWGLALPEAGTWEPALDTFVPTERMNADGSAVQAGGSQHIVMRLDRNGDLRRKGCRDDRIDPTLAVRLVYDEEANGA